MKFGGGQPAPPLPLRVGKAMIYFQCGILFLASVSAVAITEFTGGGSTLVLGGPLVGSNRLIGGGAVVVMVVGQIAAVVVLVILAREAMRFSSPGRSALVVMEIVVAVYFVGVVSSDLSSWLFGPGLSAAVIACLFWRSVNPRFAAAGVSEIPAVSSD